MEGTSSISSINDYSARPRKTNLFMCKIYLGVYSLAEYYFDMETTGFDFDEDEIITIQWQRVSGYTGEPIDELNILKRWEYENTENAEKVMIETFMPNLKCRRWDFVFAGKNLTFDFCLLDNRMRQYGLGGFDIRCLYDRAILDIKPILVMINNGNFIGYEKVMPKTNPLENRDIPALYRQGKYDRIVQYIRDEAEDFIKAYQVLKREMPNLRGLLT